MTQTAHQPTLDVDAWANLLRHELSTRELEFDDRQCEAAFIQDTQAVQDSKSDDVALAIEKAERLTSKAAGVAEIAHFPAMMRPFARAALYLSRTVTAPQHEFNHAVLDLLHVLAADSTALRSKLDDACQRAEAKHEELRHELNQAKHRIRRLEQRLRIVEHSKADRAAASWVMQSSKMGSSI